MSPPDLLHHLRGAGLVLTLTPDGGLHVAPRSALTDDHRAAIRAGRDALVLALLAAEREADTEAFEERAAIMQFDGGLSRAEAEAAVRQCADCEHHGRRRTCLEPVAAGLLTAEEGFGIVWPPEGHGAGCAAFSGKTTTKAQERPYRLSREQADAAHAKPWDEAAIARFQARQAQIMRLGYGQRDADDLAARLHLRDAEGDDRAMCLECQHYRPGRCGNHARAGLHSADVGRDLAAMLQRCPAFVPSVTTQ